MAAIGSRWDWYEATIDGLDDGQLSTSLALIFGATVTPGRGRNGYSICHTVEHDGTVLAQVYERSARHGEVHVSITSDACDDVVPVLRRQHPNHRVTRADSAVDFAADFAAIDAQVLAFATERGLTHRFITNSDGGATRYVGSPRSEVQLRVYKKTEQLRAMHPEAAATVPDGIVRFEVVVRPNKRDAKAAMGQSSPDDAWGFAQWSADLAALMLSIDAERTSTHFRRPTDLSRSLHFLAQQYGPTMRALAEQIGTAAALRELAERMELPA